jgi:hypothetical protein
MGLTLAYHPITNMQFGAATHLEGTTLHVDQEVLRQRLLEDRRLADVDVHIVRPDEICRFGVVFDILEPRAKEPGAGPDFREFWVRLRSPVRASRTSCRGLP